MKRIISKAKGMARGLLLPAAVLVRHAMLRFGMGIRQVWEVECYGPDGQLKWRDSFENLVVDVGLNEYLQRIFKSSAFTAADFVGLTDGTPTIAAGDTMASHVGWTEPVPYSQGTRPAFTPGAVASQSVDNSASKAVFSINATATVGGAFLADNNTKGGTTGILLGAGAFSQGDKSVDSGDTLNVTVTNSLTSS